MSTTTSVTLPTAEARGFSAERTPPSYLPGVHRNYWGLRLPDTWKGDATVNVLHRDGFLPATPRTFDCAKSTGPKATKHGFIARAHEAGIAGKRSSVKRSPCGRPSLHHYG